MKPRYKCHTAINYTRFLRTITDDSGSVLMDDVDGYISAFHPDYTRIVDRLQSLKGYMWSYGLGANNGKIYYWAEHRVGAPAIINHSVNRCWWALNGIEYEDTKLYCEACGFSDFKTMEWILKYGPLLPYVLDDYNI